MYPTAGATGMLGAAGPTAAGPGPRARTAGPGAYGSAGVAGATGTYAAATQRTYPHLSLLHTAVAAVVLAAHLFRPSNSGVQERVKKGARKKR